MPFAKDGTHIIIPVTVSGRPLEALVDTGLNPSGIWIRRARELGLPLGSKAVSISGHGAGTATASPTVISSLTVGGIVFPAVEALADDGPIYSANRPGPRFDMILGSSFLATGLFLIDYQEAQFVILPNAHAARALTKHCASQSVQTQAGLNAIPRIAGFRVGDRTGTALVDTGQGAAISLFAKAMQPKIEAALREASANGQTGALGAVEKSCNTLRH